MKRRVTPTADASYRAAPDSIQKAFDKQARLLVENLRHPSLRAKKIDPSRDVWQARVNRDWRFVFQIVGDTYIILDIFPHPK